MRPDDRELNEELRTIEINVKERIARVEDTAAPVARPKRSRLHPGRAEEMRRVW